MIERPRTLRRGTYEKKFTMPATWQGGNGDVARFGQATAPQQQQAAGTRWRRRWSSIHALIDPPVRSIVSFI